MSKTIEKPAPVEWVDIETIKPNEDNPRSIKEPKFKRLVKSVKDAPWMLELRPIVVNEAGTVLGGNMRLQACKAAGLKTVPVVVASGLTPDQEREFIIKDNVGFGDWDWDQLANHWDTTQLVEWGIDVWKTVDEVPVKTEQDDQHTNARKYESNDEIAVDYVNADFKKFEFYCELEDYDTIIENLKKIKAASGTDTNSDALVWLIKNWKP